MHTINFPNHINIEKFLAEYWQKKPLLVRQALPDFQCQIEPDDLAGMACEEDIESRLVLEKDGVTPWEARFGPFDESLFAELPESHWTLLVQDVDKHLPEVASLLDYFRFIPDWRLDDVMISYAADQGSVGPHTDDYDVFLLQAKGRRRWKIHTQPVDDNDYIAGLDLRILPQFETEQEWLLEPGDMLYLPPNVAHWGIAEGETMTCSVGFRAPTWQEMASTWFESRIEGCLPKERYRDPPLAPQIAPAEILSSSLEAFKAELQSSLQQLDKDERWFGRLVTESKDHLQVIPPQQPLQEQAFLNRFREQAVITRNSYSRMAFSRSEQDGMDTLYINGNSYTLPTTSGEFLPVITHYRELHFGYLQEWLEQAEYLSLLCNLYNEGHFHFSHE
ncbi:MAG: cupin domain-containing protein [Candidatus Thiodiazotropha sp. L084R]